MRLSRGGSYVDYRASLLFPVLSYVVLLRGVGPTNPAMSNDKLSAAIASVGCTQVRPLLASGNFVCKSAGRNAPRLESKIENALAEKLGLSLEAFVRSAEELEAMIKADPFKGATHGKEWYLTVTFFKDRRSPVFSKLERATMDGPEFMTGLEKRHGKHITTRTWNTLQKVLAKLQEL